MLMLKLESAQHQDERWVRWLNGGSCFQLQDRTQFSDGDLIQLKRYWDRGMTSLGSVCREKITAAANQLNVDTEIVKVNHSTGLNKEKSQFQQYS